MASKPPNEPAARPELGDTLMVIREYLPQLPTATIDYRGSLSGDDLC
jgi:hypothetical protein